MTAGPGDGADRPPRRLRPHLDPQPSGRLVARRDAVRRLAGRPPEPAVDPPAAEPQASAGTDRPATQEIARLLATASVAGIGRIVYSSNATFLLEFEADEPGGRGRPLRAVYKPVRGERPLWDFPHGTLHHREVATYVVDAALGFDVVPVTILRDGPIGPGSVQHFIHALDRDLSSDERERLEERLPVMAALDALVNNADRKSAHIMVDENLEVRGIDHGLTFLPYPRQRTVLLDLGGSPLPAQTAAAIQALDGSAKRLARLRRRLNRLLNAEEVEAFLARLHELATDPVYPVLDAWDGRPFEWW